MVVRRDISDFRWLQRWTVVKESWAVENPWISDVRDIAKTNVGPDLQSSQSPACSHTSTSAFEKTRQFRLSAEWMLG
jgi:hypothetical protein